ncbi:MAG: hypothetical protein LC122_08545 [Chitinophagales bacterium]|nr:hypothetical protein [Chitinophagales bacterium]
MKDTQIYFLIKDIKRLIGKKKLRVFLIVFNKAFWGIFIYRIERFFFICFGKAYKIIRIPFLPIISIFYWFTNIEIHYEADIKGGISILHPSLGVVISGKSKIGKNITLVGGNCIGYQSKNKTTQSSFILGDNLTLGANSTIIGPINLGDNITIGANACVVNSFTESYLILVGVPAKSVRNANHI